MRRELLESLHHYFASIQEKSEEETELLERIEEQRPFFPITHVSRDDLKMKGFDVTNISDADMDELARKMCSDYLEQFFWPSMEFIAEDGLEIPKVNNEPCPMCGEYDYVYEPETHSYKCHYCSEQWRDKYVLVEFPEDAGQFEADDSGYPCFTSEDNGARYVRESDYIDVFSKMPEPDKYYLPVRWPDSQQYLELPDNLRELCENIESGQAFEDFGPSAVWVPVCLINNEREQL